MEDNSSIPDTNQYTINHSLQVGEVQMRVSLVFTIEEEGRLSLNIENEVTGGEANFSLTHEEVLKIGKWLAENKII